VILFSFIVLFRSVFYLLISLTNCNIFIGLCQYNAKNWAVAINSFDFLAIFANKTAKKLSEKRRLLIHLIFY